MKSNQPTGGLPEDGDGKMPFLLLAVITIASLALSDMPVFSFIYSPIEYFTTALHEIGHALACSATGGSVSGMTIVSDGQGHGGLTFCQGGTHFIFGQTGYLGTTAFGCLLIIIGRHRSMTRPLLFMLAGLLTFAVFFYMMPALTMGNYAAQAMMSMVVGLVMAAALARRRQMAACTDGGPPGHVPGCADSPQCPLRHPGAGPDKHRHARGLGLHRCHQYGPRYGHPDLPVEPGLGPIFHRHAGAHHQVCLRQIRSVRRPPPPVLSATVSLSHPMSAGERAKLQRRPKQTAAK
ncbi:MAG: M50 family metallopeptidase [Candidatus Obscuribacter sp.]|nr:M50 family metallopeptidase [Candidatus Obscuribacter sp.]